MNLLSGLEKFGLKAEDTTNLFAEEKKEVVGEDGTKQEAVPTEDSFLLDKAVRCAVCDKVFKTKMIKSGRLKRLESDMDLRPRYEHIDTLKYSVISCPYCGYTAITRYFEHLSSMQVKMIKEKICVNFKPADNVEPTLIDYDTAIERYKLALFNTIVKKGKNSEKAYTCLNLAWLLRGKRESLDAKDPKMAEQIKECREQEEAFYAQAYEGFTKAVSTETYPMCGMDECTDGLPARDDGIPLQKVRCCIEVHCKNPAVCGGIQEDEGPRVRTQGAHCRGDQEKQGITTDKALR